MEPERQEVRLGAIQAQTGDQDHRRWDDSHLQARDRVAAEEDKEEAEGTCLRSLASNVVKWVTLLTTVQVSRRSRPQLDSFGPQPTTDDDCCFPPNCPQTQMCLATVEVRKGCGRITSALVTHLINLPIGSSLGVSAIHRNTIISIS